jgi:hypothetical protein
MKVEAARRPAIENGGAHLAGAYQNDIAADIAEGCCRVHRGI